MKPRMLFGAFVLLILVGALASCGGAGGGNQADCIALDASNSTRFVAPRYIDLLEAEVDEVAAVGGSVAALVTTARPGTEAIVEEASFADLSGVEKEGERGAEAHRFLAKLEGEAQASRVGAADPSKGSGIVEAISVLAHGGRCGSVTVLSDGLETEAFATQYADITSAAGRRRLIARLRVKGLTPDLAGASLSFPLGGVLPQGTGIDPAILRALPRFWAAYASATGAEFAWREPR